MQYALILASFWATPNMPVAYTNISNYYISH